MNACIRFYSGKSCCAFLDSKFLGSNFQTRKTSGLSTKQNLCNFKNLHWHLAGSGPCVCIVHNCIVDKCMTCGILKFELVSGGRWALCIHSTKLANA